MNTGVWLSHDGTRYDGWQKQGNTDRTIRSKLKTVPEKLEGSPVEAHGSGRTDVGVHTEGQVANFHLVKRMGPDKILDCMNRYLPEDIAVIRACVIPERLHSRLNAVKKTRRCQIEAALEKNMFEHHYYYGPGQKLDVEKMGQATVIPTEAYDYKSFCGSKKVKKPTVRTIESICFGQMGSRTHISFTGSGFLQRMVRILSGTLIEVGVGKRKPEEMTRVLEARERFVTDLAAPSGGLFLENIEYDDLMWLNL